jgi:hypothetical protein
MHQAAVMAASSINAVVTDQKSVNNLLRYLRHHGQHIDSINLLRGFFHAAPLRQLPHTNLQRLTSLSFNGLHLQLQPGDEFQGVLGAGVHQATPAHVLGLPLKQLQIHGCTLLDETEAFAAALAMLTELQHLSLVSTFADNRCVVFPSSVFRALQQLTYLELAGGGLQEADGLRHLQDLTHLQDLRLSDGYADKLQTSMLSGLQGLTCLKVFKAHSVGGLEAGVLADKSQLQHLELVDCSIADGSAGVAELLFQLQFLQQLTYLDLRWTLFGCDTATATAYSVLTASSKLQHLDISCCTLPPGVWQQLFPAERQLPHLRALTVNGAGYSSGAAVVMDGSRLVSCCAGLQDLKMEVVHHSAELLAPLTGLRSLSKLLLRPAGSSSEGLELVCQLTGLRWLDLCYPSEAQGLLLQLAQLKQPLLYFASVPYQPKGYFIQVTARDNLAWVDFSWWISMHL